MSGLSTLIRAPLSYKRGGMQRYKGDKREKLRLRPSSGSQVHTSSQGQYITQWSRVLRSGGPNHSKPLRVLEFIVHLPTGKTLKPLLILGLGRVHSATRPEISLSDIWRAR
jgi:hypothetical protein